MLSRLYLAYRLADRPEPAARTLGRMEDLFAKLPDADFDGRLDEYTRDYWQKQWFTALKPTGEK